MPLTSSRLGYVLGLVAVSLAVAVRWLLEPVLGETTVYDPFLVAVIVVAWVAGFGPGVFTAVLGLFVAWYIFIGSTLAFDFSETGTPVRLAINAIVGVLIATIGGLMHNARREAHLRSRTLVETLESMSDAFVRFDGELRFVYVNAAAERSLNLSRDQLLGRTLIEVLPELENTVGHREYQRALRDKVSVEFEHYQADWDRWFHAKADPAPDGGLTVYYQEITQRKRDEQALLHSEQRYRALFESMAEGFCILQVIFDENDQAVDYRYLEANPAFEKQSGIPNVVGKTINELVSSGMEQHWYDTYGRVALTGEPAQFVSHAEALGRWFEVDAFRIGEPEQRRVAVLFTDITARKRVEADLAKLTVEVERQRRLYDTIISSTPDLVYVFDLQYRFTFVNNALLEMWGRTLEQSLGKRLIELGYEPWHAEMHEREIDQVVATKQPIRGEVDFPHALLGVRVYDYIFVPVINDAGEVESVAGTTRDVTDRKRAEQDLRESEERLHLAKNAAGIGIHDYNIKMQSIDWDQRTRELWGVEADETITYDLWQQGIHPDDRDSASHAVASALDPGGDRLYHSEYRVICRKDGVMRWIQVTGHPTFDGDTATRLVGTVQDITQRKAAERALREANMRKDEFLATLAHELRNPLAAVRMAVNVIKHARDDQTQFDEMTDIIERQSAQLVRLIDDLLDVSRITRGKVDLHMKPLDFASVVAHAVEGVRSTCDTRGLKLSVTLPENPIIVNADGLRLAQVISNLMNNACKFTDRGDEVRVEVALENDQAIVRVQDTGMGIPHDQLKRIFELFAQVDAGPGRSADGLGIGLSLAKSLTERHGGVIDAYSRGRGHGSEFVVRLPVAEVSSQDAPRALIDQPGDSAPSLRAVRSRRVLAVDDNHDALTAVQQILQLEGHEVETAEDGEKALQLARDHQPEAVLLDIGMPGLDGYEVARRIRSEPWGKDMLLVAMTGWGQTKDKQLAFDAGFDEHLTKPADPNTLQRILARDKT